MLIRWLAALAVVTFATAASSKSVRLEGTATVRIEVTRDGDRWTADYLFDRDAPAWVLPRTADTRESSVRWRPLSWTMEPAGVRVERLGSHDVLVARRGLVPRRVRIHFSPFAQGLLHDYPPALAFTDGSVALYVAQFEVFPMVSAAAAKALPSDLNNQMVPNAALTYVFRDKAGPVWLGGARYAVAQTTDTDTYVFFGTLKPLETPDMVGFIDPQLPAWIRESISRSVPDMLSRYARELGPTKEVKPTIMLSWAGPTPRLTSRAGSVLHGLIVLNYEGEGVLAETLDARIDGLRFIAHEAAHFWLGQSVSYEYARDAWITEGGADLLAVRLVAEEQPTFDWKGDIDHSIEDCADLTRGRGVEGARDRNESRAYYACGAVFGLIAERASGKSFFAFARKLIDANRADGVVTRGEWLAALDDASKKPDLSRDIARLLDQGVPDPKAFIASLFERAGVEYDLDARGTPRLR